jgi:hypothetical protein
VVGDWIARAEEVVPEGWRDTVGLRLLDGAHGHWHAPSGIWGAP